MFNFLFAENSRTEVREQQMERHDGSTSEAKTPSTPSITNYMSRGSQASTWSTNSSEYDRRLESLLRWLINSGNPVTIVDQEDFREMLHTMDPKFKSPGKYLVSQFPHNPYSFLFQSTRVRVMTNNY